MKRRRSSDLAELMAAQLRLAGVRDFVRELVAVPGRRFRVDIALPAARIAVECQGGIYTGGRHVSPAGYTREAEKFCMLAIEGWRVMPVTAEQIRDGRALGWILQAVQASEKRETLPDRRHGSGAEPGAQASR